MKRFNLITLAAAIILALSMSSITYSQDSTKTKKKEMKKEQKRDGKEIEPMSKVQHGNRFVDENQDGYNDNAPDADNDGIPNGQDPDYDGPKSRAGNKSGRGFVDENADGINDNIQKVGKSNKGQRGKGGFGPKDGTGNKGMGPKDGTGNGPGAQSGNCDGTGPKGQRNRGGKK
ncbi:MAG: hypothetical protein V2J62_03120 [candidate division KSB1 bacterium]|jgi:hypothetical protein|nr:hypothetical protein [candidate division KSB1 bacterium]